MLVTESIYSFFFFYRNPYLIYASPFYCDSLKKSLKMKLLNSRPLNIYETTAFGGVLLLGGGLATKLREFTWLKSPIHLESLATYLIINASFVTATNYIGNTSNEEVSHFHKVAFDVAGFGASIAFFAILARPLTVRSRVVFDGNIATQIAAFQLAVQTSLYVMYVLFSHFAQVPEPFAEKISEDDVPEIDLSSVDVDTLTSEEISYCHKKLSEESITLSPEKCRKFAEIFYLFNLPAPSEHFIVPSSVEPEETLVEETLPTWKKIAAYALVALTISAPFFIAIASRNPKAHLEAGYSSEDLILSDNGAQCFESSIFVNPMTPANSTPIKVAEDHKKRARVQAQQDTIQSSFVIQLDKSAFIEQLNPEFSPDTIPPWGTYSVLLSVIFFVLSESYRLRDRKRSKKRNVKVIKASQPNDRGIPLNRLLMGGVEGNFGVLQRNLGFETLNIDGIRKETVQLYLGVQDGKLIPLLVGEDRPTFHSQEELDLEALLSNSDGFTDQGGQTNQAQVHDAIDKEEFVFTGEIFNSSEIILELPSRSSLEGDAEFPEKKHSQLKEEIAELEKKKGMIETQKLTLAQHYELCKGKVANLSRQLKKLQTYFSCLESENEFNMQLKNTVLTSLEVQEDYAKNLLKTVKRESQARPLTQVCEVPIMRKIPTEELKIAWYQKVKGFLSEYNAVNEENTEPHVTECTYQSNVDSLNNGDLRSKIIHLKQEIKRFEDSCSVFRVSVNLQNSQIKKKIESRDRMLQKLKEQLNIPSSFEEEIGTKKRSIEAIYKNINEEVKNSQARWAQKAADYDQELLEEYERVLAKRKRGGG